MCLRRRLYRDSLTRSLSPRRGCAQALCPDWLMSVETLNSGLTEREECVLSSVIEHVHTHTQTKQLHAERCDLLTLCQFKGAKTKQQQKIKTQLGRRLFFLFLERREERLEISSSVWFQMVFSARMSSDP